MSTPKVIVAGIDGSSAAANAALWAAGEAQLQHAELRLLYAYTVPATSTIPTPMTPPNISEQLKEAGKHILATGRLAVLDVYPRLEVSTRLCHEWPAEALRGAAERALLTVVGSHGAGAIVETLLGSVAAKLIGHLDHPLAVVRTDLRRAQVPPGGPVAVGLDGTPESDAALGYAFGEASIRQVSLVALHSWDAQPLAGFSRVYPLEIDRHLVDAQERHLTASRLAPWIQQYPQVKIEQMVVHGRPAEALVHYCEENAPSLMVLGRRARHGLTGMLPNAIVHAVVAHGSCPVVVCGDAGG